MILPGIELKWTFEDATIVQGSNVKNPITFDTLERSMQVLLVAKGTTHFSMLQTIISSRTAKNITSLGMVHGEYKNC